jgi:hypothetical protein
VAIVREERNRLKLLNKKIRRLFWKIEKVQELSENDWGDNIKSRGRRLWHINLIEQVISL